MRKAVEFGEGLALAVCSRGLGSDARGLRRRFGDIRAAHRRHAGTVTGPCPSSGSGTLAFACAGSRSFACAVSGSCAGAIARPAPSPAPAPAPARRPPRPRLPPRSPRRMPIRLADQASFGATETLIADIRVQGRAGWIAAQMSATASRYTAGNGDAIHKNTSNTGFCDQSAYTGPTCWRDWYSSQPLVWDFYRNATQNGDQLRQRVAFALQQIVVVNNLDVEGTYGLRNYHNTLLDNAFGNYRQVLKKVTLSPVMGDFLNNANNDKAAPNENYARELLQLFSIGTCELNADGTVKGGACAPTYNNETVRNYAYALTGWTYPAGGATPYGCWPTGANCRYYGGDMVAVTHLPRRQRAPAAQRPQQAGEQHAGQRARAGARQRDAASEHRAVHQQAADPAPGLQQPESGLRAACRRGLHRRHLQRRGPQLRRRPARRPGGDGGGDPARQRGPRRDAGTQPPASCASRR